MTFFISLFCGISTFVTFLKTLFKFNGEIPVPGLLNVISFKQIFEFFLINLLDTMLFLEEFFFYIQLFFQKKFFLSLPSICSNFLIFKTKFLNSEIVAEDL